MRVCSCSFKERLPIMLFASRTSLFAITLSAMAAASLYAQAKQDTAKLISSLSGTWKEDESKRKLGSAPGLRFRATTSGDMEELRGPESKPMVQPVKFDGKTYPMDSGNSLSWKQIDANNFERRTFQNGKLLSVRRISHFGRRENAPRGVRSNVARR